MSYGCPLDLLWMSFGSLMDVLCLMNVLCLSYECPLDVLWMSYECLMDVIINVLNNFKGKFSRMCFNDGLHDIMDSRFESFVFILFFLH